tara:strand:+ start:428 stop:580 length:153 start_codon:yes stop_codon:yes gene_type:complete
MNMNYSKQTYATVIQQYEWRVQSLLNKIDELQARLDISDAEFDKIRKDIF